MYSLTILQKEKEGMYKEHPKRADGWEVSRFLSSVQENHSNLDYCIFNDTIVSLQNNWIKELILLRILYEAVCYWINLIVKYYKKEKKKPNNKLKAKVKYL